MGKHVKDYSSSNKSRSNLCKDFFFEVLNIITEYWCTLIKTCAVCHACDHVKHLCGLTISFQLFWCGFLCKDFFIETKYLLLSDNIPLMGCRCVYTSLCTKTVSDLWCVCFGVFMYIIAFVFLSNSLIFEKFSSEDPDTKDNSVGIQLLGIVLANNLPPFDPKCEIDRVR